MQVTLDRQLCIWVVLVASTCRISLGQEGPKDSLAPSTPSSQTFDANEPSVRLVRITRDWLKNKISTPGTSAEVREIDRERHSGDVQIDYHVFVKGAPKDQLYDVRLWSISAKEPSVVMSGVSIAPNGLLICAGRKPGQCRGEKLDDDIALSVLNPGKGEPFRWVLVSGDDKTQIFFAAIPDSITAKDKSCRLEVIRLLPKFELAMIRAKGYKANEELQFTSKSYNEAHDVQARANADGEYVAAMLPAVKDKQIGKTDVILKGAECAPKLSFEWGR
jgi:hypothetical protein